MHKIYSQLNNSFIYKFISDGAGCSDSDGNYSLALHKKHDVADDYFFEEDVSICPSELFLFFEPDYWEL